MKRRPDIFVHILLLPFGFMFWLFRGFLRGLGFAFVSPKNVDYLHFMDTLTGEEFEEFLGELFTDYGYSVFWIGGQGDQGCDLILEKDDLIIVVQAKRYMQAVGNTSVQEIYAAKAHYEADEAWVVTNSYFTDSAKELAESTNVWLVDRDALLTLI
ncbi:MAG: restriction endonuclease [Firmicutes bacterium]|nr:restriction endonuclease [Bacillota bacterium]